MIQTLLVTPVPAETDSAAATAIRHAGERLHASATDIVHVLDVLFAPILSFNPVAQLIRTLVTAGRENATIASVVGCSIQAVVGVRGAMTNAVAS